MNAQGASEQEKLTVIGRHHGNEVDLRQHVSASTTDTFVTANNEPIANPNNEPKRESFIIANSESQC